MKRLFAFWLGLLLLVSIAAAQSMSGAQSKEEPALPYIPSLDVGSMDKSVDPCVDLYHYSCGGWQKQNPIPPDQTSWSVYGKLYQDNLMFLRGILEQAGTSSSQRDPAPRRSAISTRRAWMRARRQTRQSRQSSRNWMR